MWKPNATAPNPWRKPHGCTPSTRATVCPAPWSPTSTCCETTVTKPCARNCATLVRGVRCKPRPDADALRDPRWRAGLEALVAHGLSWDLRVPYWQLEAAAALTATVPGLRVAVEHAGLPWDRSEAGIARWLQGMRALAALPDVHVKLSEFGLPDAAWDRADNVRIIRLAIDAFGAARCMFASNLPVSGLRAGIGELLATMTEAMQGLPSHRRARSGATTRSRSIA